MVKISQLTLETEHEPVLVCFQSLCWSHVFSVTLQNEVARPDSLSVVPAEPSLILKRQETTAPKTTATPGRPPKS